MTRFGLLRTLTARNLTRFFVDRQGATAIEYGLLVSLIALGIMTTVFSMGQGINNTLYGAISNALASMM